MYSGVLEYTQQPNRKKIKLPFIRKTNHAYAVVDASDDYPLIGQRKTTICMIPAPHRVFHLLGVGESQEVAARKKSFQVTSRTTFTDNAERMVSAHK